MTKPIIGVTSLFDDERDSIWMLPSYLNVITDLDGIPVILPIIDDENDIRRLVRQFDGFLITGGQDVNPAIYNEKRAEHCGNTNNGRDIFEQILIDEVLNLDKPLLAICRGFQLLNAYLGGTLYQDIKIEKNNNIESIHKQDKPYYVPSHKIEIKEDSLLFDITDKKELLVNSMHHQAIKKLSTKLKVAAISEDEIIESAYMENKKFVLGVQWHPELLYKDYEEQKNIFKKFIENAL